MRFLVLIIAFVGLCFNSAAQHKMPADTLRWQQERKLKWSDFKGAPIDAPGLFGEIFCLLPARYKKDGSSAEVKYEVFTIVDKNASWVHPQRKKDITLKFFQLHFDLFECYARRIRKDCTEADFGSNPSEVFSKIYDTQMGALALELKQMKSDTKMGNNELQIQAWRVKTGKSLETLSTFTNNTLD